MGKEPGSAYCWGRHGSSSSGQAYLDGLADLDNELMRNIFFAPDRHTAPRRVTPRLTSEAACFAITGDTVEVTLMQCVTHLRVVEPVRAKARFIFQRLLDPFHHLP